MATVNRGIELDGLTPQQEEDVMKIIKMEVEKIDKALRDVIRDVIEEIEDWGTGQQKKWMKRHQKLKKELKKKK